MAGEPVRSEVIEEVIHRKTTREYSAPAPQVYRTPTRLWMSILIFLIGWFRQT